MHSDARIIPWDPIPRESNVYMDVDIQHVEEHANTEGTPVAIMLVAPRGGGGDGAWRLLFQHVTAYRRLPVEAHVCVHLTELRKTCEKRSLPTPATFEVVHSPWLQEAIGPDYSRPNAVRHFVIAASYVAYEIAAEWCEVQELDDPE